MTHKFQSRTENITFREAQKLAAESGCRAHKPEPGTQTIELVYQNEVQFCKFWYLAEKLAMQKTPAIKKPKEKFLPMLFPNQILPLSDIYANKSELLCSHKFDGVRCIIKNGRAYTRNMKTIPNKGLQDALSAIKEYSRLNDCILDGELWSKRIPFADLAGIIMSKGGDHSGISFYCFDTVVNENYEMPLYERAKRIPATLNGLVKVKQSLCDIDQAEEMFRSEIRAGGEGIMLRDPASPYKKGRATIRQSLGFKLKLFETFDAEVIEVLKQSVGQIAGAFLVNYNGRQFKVSIHKSNREKSQIWNNRAQFPGQAIEFKGMQSGSRNVPRHATFVRFRTDIDA